MAKSTFFCVIVILLALTLWGGALPKPVLHASFDRDFRADSVIGSVEGKHSQQLTMETISVLIRPGIKGNAAKVGVQGRGMADVSVVEYPAEMVEPLQGSIAFWVNPLDWDFKDGKFHVLAEASGSDDWLLIYKYCDVSDLYFLYGKKNKVGNENGFTIAAAPAIKWEKGEYHHVTATWEKNVIKLYIDGILKSSMKIPRNKRPDSFSRFTIGPNKPEAWSRSNGDTLIDDLQIFDRALTSSEVERLFVTYGVGGEDKSKIPVKVSVFRLLGSVDKKHIVLDFVLSRTTSKSVGFPVKMSLKHNGKPIDSMTVILNSNSSEYNWSFDVSQMAAGEYELNLTPQVEKNTDVIEAYKHIFTVGEAPKIIDNSVPVPFTPIKVIKNRKQEIEVQTLAQKYIFGQSLFPMQMFSETTPVLRSGMTFCLNGQPVEGKIVSSVKAHNEETVRVENIFKTATYELKTKSRVEFDGMVWFDVILTPFDKMEVNMANIQLLLNPEISTLYNEYHKDYYKFSGFRAGSLNKTIKCNHFTNPPMLWVGNEERGIYYFAENQQNRRLKKRAETLTLFPSDSGAILKINLVDYPWIINRPVKWSFGLQVTPMRPYYANRRQWRPWRSVNLWFPWEVRHNVPDARFAYPDYTIKFKQNSANGTQKVFHYFAGFSASPDNPGYPQHAHNWSQNPPVTGTLASPNSPEWKYIFICPNSESYRNTYLRDLGKCIDLLPIKHIYIDNCWSISCANTQHGCSWQDEFGNMYPTFSVLGARALAKGVYRELKRRNPEGLVVRHISQIPEPPLVAFADCLVDGECFMKDVGASDNYYQVFTPDFFRASFLGRQYGIPSLFIPQFERAYLEHFPEKLKPFKSGSLQCQEKYYRHFIGYFLVHDSGIWPNFGIKMDKYWKLFDQVGVKDNSSFYGYWEGSSPVKKVAPQLKEVMVSSYEIKSGFLTVIMNDSDKNHVITIKHPFSNAVMYDLENNEEVNTKLSVSARDFKLVKIISKNRRK